MIGPVHRILASLPLAAATLAFAAPSLRADTLTVPGDAPTIQGAIVLAAAVPSGFSLWAQYWYPDAGAVFGFAGSNGVGGLVP